MATFKTTTVDNKELIVQIDKVEEQFLEATLVRVYVDGKMLVRSILEEENEIDCLHNKEVVNA